MFKNTYLVKYPHYVKKRNTYLGSGYVDNYCKALICFLYV